MLLVMMSSLYCIENVLFFICLLEGVGIIPILILETISLVSIHINLYVLLKKNKSFPIPYFTYNDVQALIEGYGRSKFYIIFSSNE